MCRCNVGAANAVSRAAPDRNGAELDSRHTTSVAVCVAGSHWHGSADADAARVALPLPAQRVIAPTGLSSCSTQRGGGEEEEEGMHIRMSLVCSDGWRASSLHAYLLHMYDVSGPAWRIGGI